MPNLPLISVIVPVYNGEEFLHKCVNSILSQTYTNLEVVLVNDGSTDLSGKICDEYAKRENRIVVVHQSNGGVSAAQNAGIKAARGEYISIVGQDDWLAPSFIETLWQTAHKYHAPISVVGRCVVFSTKSVHKPILPSSETEKLISTTQPFFNTQQALEFTFSLNTFVTNKLIKKTLFEFALFPEGLVYDDLWILPRLYQHVNKIAVCNKPLYYYNACNENSQSCGKFNPRMLDYFKVTDEFMVWAQKDKYTRMLRKLQRKRLAHICYFFRRIMLADLNDESIITPMYQELRRNLWILLFSPRPLTTTAFGIACAINFQMTKKILRILYKKSY